MRKEQLGKYLLWIYFIVTAINLIGVGLRRPVIIAFSKPLMMSTLIVYYLVVSGQRNKIYLVALIFSLLGDIFLLDKNGYFLFGLGSFLVTQALFIVLVKQRTKTISRTALLLSVVPFVIYLVLLMRVLAPSLEALFYPVLVYGSVISIFGICALHHYLIRRDAASRILLTGALLFIVSDSMIAINEFYSPYMIYPVAIMLTYALAQYLICQYILMEEH